MKGRRAGAFVSPLSFPYLFWAPFLTGVPHAMRLLLRSLLIVALVWFASKSFGYTPPNLQDLRADAARLLTTPPTSLRRETALGCLAVTIYHEARGEPVEGQVAVGSVVLVRVFDPRWPDTVCDVIRQPVQFSYLTRSGGPADFDHAPIRKGTSWETAVRAAAYALLKGPLPELRGADHYHATYVDPTWNDSMEETARIGLHRFFLSTSGR